MTDWNILSILHKEENITKTSEILYMSQPAISYRLNSIEKEFGVKIYYKNKNGITFTVEGKHLVTYAEDMIERLSNIKNNIYNLSNEVQGNVRIGVSSNFALYKLPQALKGFKLLYPKVKVDIITGLSKDIKKAMEGGEIYVGIVKGYHNWHDKKHLLQKERQYIISKEELDISNLPDYPRIEYNADPLFKKKVDNWWKNNYQKKPFNIMRIDKVEICKKMVSNGLGYAIIPGICLTDNNEFYTNILLNKNNKPIVRNIWLYYREKHSSISSINAIVKFLINYKFE